MKILKKHFTTITPFSHYLTLVLLVILPLAFLGIGLMYYKEATKTIDQFIKTNFKQSTLQAIEGKNRLTDLEYHNIEIDFSTLIATESPREALNKLSILMKNYVFNIQRLKYTQNLIII